MGGRYPAMNGQVAPRKRLKSRESFPGACEHITKRSSEERLENVERGINIHQQSWRSITLWTLTVLPRLENIKRAETARTWVNIVKRGIEGNPRCDCGELQDEGHLLKFTNSPLHSTIQDRKDLNDQLTEISRNRFHKILVKSERGT